MMTSINNLITGRATKQGNHRVETIGDITKYIYHNTTICTVNNVKKTFKTDNGGWDTQSTTRAINDYKRQFTAMGYTAI